MGSLRTLLALSVVFAHLPLNAGYVFVGGRNAVQLFYMISGFVISHVLLNTPAYRDVKTFYASRWLRLYPVYYAVLLLTLAYFMLGSRLAVYSAMPPSAVAALVVSNVVIFGQDWIMFLAVHDGHLHWTGNFRQSDVLLYDGLLVPQAWTLGLELSFYLLAPFLVRRIRWVLVIIAVSLAARAVLVWRGIGLEDPWVYRFFPLEVAFFLGGMLSQQYLLPYWKERVGMAGRKLPALATALLAVATAIYFVIPVPDMIKTPILFAVFLWLLPLAFLFQQMAPWDSRIGDLSYPMYISHLLAIWVTGSVLVRVGVPHGTSILETVAGLVASVVAALLLDRWIARPVESLRRRLRGSPSPASPPPVGDKAMPQVSS